MKNISLALALLLISGCTSKSEVSLSESSDERANAISKTAGRELPSSKFATGDAANGITVNGWKIEYPKSLKRLNMTMIDGVMKLEFERFTFSVRGDKIFIDGTNYGTASPGDNVLVGIEGDIAVNGKIREPVPD